MAENFTGTARRCGLLAEVGHRQGRLLGQMQALSAFGLREEAVLRTLTEDVVQMQAK